MDDPLQHLIASLEGRYEIVREVGRGGMATVYLARDVRHDRLVAIKLFRPELATEAGAARFAREIEVAARLSHPGILALHDSGSADGVPYYVMPFVDGESLADRIAREGQLPIGEALRITRQVAAALQHAHDQGIVHRDIKPDNIMLSGDAVLVADFGIAHAVQSIGTERLTATGLSVGTPTFMSPEQIAGTARVDGRADLYSLGCVLYTMLIGEPPFGGTSVQAILARHLAEPVPQLRVVRSTIPRAVEAVVHRAMAKSPVDRFATARDFADALAPEHLGDESLDAILRPRRSRRRWLALAGAAVLVALVFWLRPWSLTRRATGEPGPLDPAVVAILPFNLGGIADSTIRALGADIPLLLAQRLPGDGGPRGVAVEDGSDSRSTGAGLVLQGHLASVGGRLTVAGTLRQARDDSLLARVDDISGPLDSFPVLLDRLVAGLLIDRAKPPPERERALAALPLPALRQFFEAIRLFIAGQMFESARGFEAVLAAHPDCYPAALWLGTIRQLQLDAGLAREPLQLAEAQRDRMSQADRIQLASLQHWSDPGRTRTIDAGERLQRLSSAANARNEPETWYVLAERYFHDGPLLGLPDMQRLAERSFERALTTTPTLLPALGHSIDLAAARGDTAKVRRMAARYFALDSVGELSDYYRWRVATALDDRRALDDIRDRMPEFAPASLEQVVNVAQLDGIGLADAALAAEILWARSDASNQARWAFVKQRELALNTGRPGEARRILEQWQQSGIEFRPQDGMAEVVNTIFWGADTTRPSAWVTANAPATDRLWRPSRASVMSEGDYALCGVSLWRSLRGSGPLASSEVPLRPIAPGTADDGNTMVLCASIVAAALSARNGAPDAGRHLVLLDSLVASLPRVTTWLLSAANLTAARLWEAQGRIDRALIAVRRRPYITDVREPRVLVALATMVREEGRLAALTGDTAAATAAFRHYLALHADAEPGVQREVEDVRTALRRLTGN